MLPSSIDDYLSKIQMGTFVEHFEKETEAEHTKLLSMRDETKNTVLEQVVHLKNKINTVAVP